jgi:hypothetical protein
MATETSPVKGACVPLMPRRAAVATRRHCYMSTLRSGRCGTSKLTTVKKSAQSSKKPGSYGNSNFRRSRAHAFPLCVHRGTHVPLTGESLTSYNYLVSYSIVLIFSQQLVLMSSIAWTLWLLCKNALESPQQRARHWRNAFALDR